MAKTVRERINYPSDSDMGVTHVVNIYEDDTISCSCRGFNSPTKCWHVKKEAAKRGRMLDVSTWGAKLGPAIDPNAPVIETVEKIKKPRKAKAKQVVLPVDDDEADDDNVEPVIKQSSFLPSLKVNGFVEPMCASALKTGDKLENYSNAQHVMELKVDGHRMIVEVSTDGVWAWSRAEKSRMLPPHIIKQLRLLPPGTYDGELYFPGGTSTDVTRLDIQHLLKLVFFDMLRVGSESCMDRPSTERRALLEVALSPLTTDEVSIIAQFPVSREALQQIWDAGGEGVIIKNTSIRYSPGKRSREWIKFKQELLMEVVVYGFEEGSLGPHSVILGRSATGVETRCKTLNDAWRADFAKNWKSYIGRTLVITFQQLTNTGSPRHPMADHFLDKE
jgi:hypothetical protein